MDRFLEKFNHPRLNQDQIEIINKTKQTNKKIRKGEKLRNQSHSPLQQTIKYLGINLHKETKELYTENYKTLMKEKNNINRGRDIPYFWVGRINVEKMTILPDANYSFSLIPIKLPMAFFTELEQKNSQFFWKHKDPE